MSILLRAKHLNASDRLDLLGTDYEGFGFDVDDETPVVLDGDHYVTLDLFLEWEAASGRGIDLDRWVDPVEERERQLRREEW